MLNRPRQTRAKAGPEALEVGQNLLQIVVASLNSKMAVPSVLTVVEIVVKHSSSAFVPCQLLMIDKERQYDT